MIAISRTEMIALEQKAINDFKIPSIVLMENAAMGFVRALIQDYGIVQSKKVCILCGKGNR